MKSIKSFPFVILFTIHFASPLDAENWYVDNAATGANTGTSWNNAWQSFDDIQWSTVHPGDTVFISGGSTEKVYSEQLSINAGGTENNVITIKAGQNTGHNGRVIIDMSEYDQTDTECGIWIMSQSYVVIDGNYNNQQHIIVKNSSNNGIHVYADCHHVVLKYLEVAFNGGEDYPNNGIHIQISGQNYMQDSIIEISHCKIHDNWQDQIFLNDPGNPNYNTDYTEYLSFGKISVHHNEIYNFTDDGFVCTAGCTDFFNNRIYNRINNSRGVGHPDGLEFYGEYYRIYNNSFSNFLSYGKVSNAYIGFHLGEGYYGPDIDPERPVHHIYINNNLFYEENLPYQITDPDYEHSIDYIRGIEFAMHQERVHEVHDVLIANNHFIKIPAWAMIIPLSSISSSENISNFRILNNVIYNCYTNGGGQAMIIALNDTLTIGSASDDADLIVDYNLIHPGDNGSSLIGYKGSIISYQEWKQQSGCNDYGLSSDPEIDTIDHMPISEVSPLVNNGIDLSFLVNGQSELQFVQYDINGNLRPSDAWDIGAYEYSTGTYIYNTTANRIQLFQNYPNPFKNNTKIEYTLPKELDIEISLYDITGKKAAILFKGHQNSGKHNLDVLLNDIAAGIYFYKLETGNYNIIKKCIISQ